MRLQMVLLGTVEAVKAARCILEMIIEWLLAVLGTLMLGCAVLRFVTVLGAKFVATASVFGSCLRSGLCSPLYSYSFTFLTPLPLAEKFIFQKSRYMVENITQIDQVSRSPRSPTSLRNRGSENHQSSPTAYSINRDRR